MGVTMNIPFDNVEPFFAEKRRNIRMRRGLKTVILCRFADAEDVVYYEFWGILIFSRPPRFAYGDFGLRPSLKMTAAYG